MEVGIRSWTAWKGPAGDAGALAIDAFQILELQGNEASESIGIHTPSCSCQKQSSDWLSLHMVPGKTVVEAIYHGRNMEVCCFVKD